MVHRASGRSDHRPHTLAPLFPAEKSQHRIGIECPLCRALQTEPSLAVSTYCLGCGVHLDIRKGVATAPYSPSMTGFTPARQDLAPELGRISEGPEDLRTGVVAPIRAPIRRLATEKIRRDVTCPECRHDHRAAPRFSSTLCPNCGVDISLRDYLIDKPWSNPIVTQGTVRITKKGKVRGSSIKCHNLFLEGTFQGGVDCTGDFIISSSGRLMGHARCKRLKVEKRAEVTFLNGVEAETVSIDGLVFADIVCQGKLSLLKKAILTGNITVGTLTVEEGASHRGQIAMRQADSRFQDSTLQETADTIDNLTI